MLHIVCVCVCGLSYPACNAPYYTVISGLSGYIQFFLIISYIARFSGKKVTEHKMCLEIFLQLSSETFRIPKRTEMCSKMYIGLRVKYRLFLSGFI